ncbi:hypothetical protein [Microbacterium sp. NPDC089696]|uniref:hypothetical protein n=1 Tax=Microbacterium sp. NPDC089696 TaxID=3364199 RepID=UPI00382708C3
MSAKLHAVPEAVTDIAVTGDPPEFDPRQTIEDALPEGMEWDERELVLLGILGRQAQHVEKLEAELADRGYVDTGSKGQVRISPFVSELRLQYAAMARVAEAIRLPDEAEKPKSVRHQRAANRRWNPGGVS